MSGTPIKRVHDDSGGHSSIAGLSHTQDDSGSYSGMGPANSKMANPSAPIDYHSASFDIGPDTRLPKVPRTEIDSRRSPLLPMYRMQPSSLNDSQSDHAVKPEERDDVKNVRDSKVESRDVKSQSKESFQGAKSDKDVRYTSKGDDHKKTEYEVKTDKEAYNAMNSQINWNESKDHHKSWKYPDTSGGNLEEQWDMSHSSNVKGENFATRQKDYTEAREAVNNGIKDPTKEKETDRKDHTKKDSWIVNEKDGLQNEKKDADVLLSSSKAMDQDNLSLEQRKQKITDGETKDVEIEGEKQSKGFDKDSDDGGMDVGGSTNREQDLFNFGVQKRKRMLRPRGSPKVGNRDPRFRSHPHDNDGSNGKGDVSAVLYRVGECMQELIKLWKEYDLYEPSKNSETSKTGPILEIRIPAKHVCATNRQVKGGQLWGTDIYTNDSDLVAVLMHTGYCRPTASPPPPAIHELRATVKVLPPQKCYGSTLRNNVRSRAWGAAIGCSYRVERCYIVKKGGGTINLEPCLTHISTVEPTLAPVVVERTMTTRAAASNALRRQRFVRELTLQYNLCNEPWIKYSISAISDKGLKKPLFTSARLKKGEVLYMESHDRRYELCFNGEKIVKATAHANEADANDVFRWSVCKKPLPETVMCSIGIPLPPEHLHVLEENLDWEDIQWSQTGVWISRKEYRISRVHFLSPV